MAADSSFDVVSKVDRQEVDNALNQAAKEVSQRFDFKNTDAKIAWSGENIEMRARAGVSSAAIVLPVSPARRLGPGHRRIRRTMAARIPCGGAGVSRTPAGAGFDIR